jgi:SPP1 gp7 family putative phage head morphogenesis protein
MPDPQLGAVPFQEAITYFRRKLNVTTKRWHDMMRTEHAKGFTVAGATKTDLLLDLRGAVDEAITEGQSLGQFKKGFDQIVAKHGWNFKGKPSWRARTIFNTNLRTATMAGRWEQAQRTKARRPFGIYETAGDERVRPQHREWDRTVLPLDDPWFDVHWPPNGWGCRCHVRTASERQLEREGLVVTKRPPTATVETFDPSTLDPVTGEAQKVDVPVGIDLGWDYNVGKAYLGSDAAFGEKLMQLPARSRTAALVSTVQVVPYLLPSFRRWARQALDDSVARGETRTAGWLSAKTVDFLERYPDAPFPAPHAARTEAPPRQGHCRRGPRKPATAHPQPQSGALRQAGSRTAVRIRCRYGGSSGQIRGPDQFPAQRRGIELDQIGRRYARRQPGRQIAVRAGRRKSGMRRPLRRDAIQVYAWHPRIRASLLPG